MSFVNIDNHIYHIYVLCQGCEIVNLLSWVYFYEVDLKLASARVFTIPNLCLYTRLLNQCEIANRCVFVVNERG